MPLQMQAIPEAENNSSARNNFLPVSWQAKKRIWVSMLKKHCYQSRPQMTASLWIPAQYIASDIPVDFMHHHLYPTEAIHAEQSRKLTGTHETSRRDKLHLYRRACKQKKHIVPCQHPREGMVSLWTSAPPASTTLSSYLNQVVLGLSTDPHACFNFSVDW